jgi:CBS domain-containing protein
MMTVGDVMTTYVVTVKASTPIKEVARLLVERGISGMPVVDDTGAVLGVVSEGDLLLKESGPEVVRKHRLGRLVGDQKAAQVREQKVKATTAGEAMTSPPITVRPNQTLVEAARLMTGQLVNRLVVISDEKLVGIVTRADLVRAFVRADDELADTIRTEVLLRIMWLDPAAFTVRVAKGVATISGHVEHRSTAEAIETAIAMVPGIVGVEADITWSLEEADVRPVTVDAFFPYSPR